METRPWARITMVQLAAVVGVATVLAVAQDIFMPLAIAMLITFALSPVVTFLRRQGLPLLATVLIVVSLAFALIGAVAVVFGIELGTLAQNLPTFQANILAKVEALKSASDGGSLIARLSDMIEAVNSQIGTALPGGGASPMVVEVVQPTNAMDVIQGLVLQLIGPAASSGLVIVLVIFMLLEREALRDRFIRLLGSNDLHRTTQVLQEAGSRVAKYLLIQLFVNAIYALPIGLGLWLIGVPNPALWGLLTLILRFVPFIGSALSAAFPLFLAFAVSPNWSAVLWTLALFGVVELITSNVIEPWLYGSRTGLSPLAIIVAAIVWTYLWGPLGLVLSTPLTVCLVVLGRHVPQFGIFDILLGDEPMLAPHAKLYQRLLVGDALEASFGAEEALEAMDLSDYHQDIMIPALLLAQDDLDRGVLTPEQEDRLASVALGIISELAEDTTPTTGPTITILGGRRAIDDVVALILAQGLQAEGAKALARAHGDLAPSRLPELNLPDCSCLILTFLDRNVTRASLLHLRRLKRAAPGLRVGVVLLQMPQGLHDANSGLRDFPPVSAAKISEALDLGADFAVTTLEAAVLAAFDQSPSKPVPPRAAPIRRSRRQPQGEAK